MAPALDFAIERSPLGDSAMVVQTTTPAPEGAAPSSGGPAREGAHDEQQCGECGATSPQGYRFCLGCGAVLAKTVADDHALLAVPDEQADQADSVAGAEPVMAQRVVPIEGDTSAAVVISCTQCGAVCSGGETTCQRCGAPVAGLAPGSSAGQRRGDAAAAPPSGARSESQPAPPASESDLPFELAPARRRESEPYHVAPSARRTGNTDRPGGRPRKKAASQPITGRLVVIVEDGSEGAVLELRGTQMDLGRSDGDIVFAEDRYMSPRHARLVCQDGAWHLRDLDSTNGVYRRLRKPEVLADGDLVLLGLEVLQFQLVDHTERGLGHATQHGTLVFGSPAASRPARLCQRTVEGIVRDVYHLVSDETTVGREIGDIVFTSDPFMSRRHAVIKWQQANEYYVLADLNSSNGTYLAIRGDVRLHHGDFIRIGQHLFRADFPSLAGSAPHEDR